MSHPEEYEISFLECLYNCANLFLPTAREGNIFTGVCLSTVGLMDTGSLLGLFTARLVCILLECFLVAGSLESANSSILAVRRLFKDFGGGKIRVL